MSEELPVMPENAAAKTATQLALVTSTEGDATGSFARVRCTGKLIAGSTGILQTEVRSLLPGTKRIVLDLTDLGYMDSSGLGAIIGLYVSVKSAGGRLEVINLSARVRQLFSITNVISLFEVCGEQSNRVV
jgi:anti-sigma B factor antagonist